MLEGEVQTESLSQHIYIKEFDLGSAQHPLKTFSIFFRIRETEVTKGTIKEKEVIVKTS